MNIEQERKAFEQWMNGHGELDMPRMPDGSYRFRSDEYQWEAWQARAAQPLPVEAIEAAIVALMDARHEWQQYLDIIAGKHPLAEKRYTNRINQYEKDIASLRALLPESKDNG